MNWVELTPEHTLTKKWYNLDQVLFMDSEYINNPHRSHKLYTKLTFAAPMSGYGNNSTTRYYEYVRETPEEIFALAAGKATAKDDWPHPEVYWNGPGVMTEPVGYGGLTDGGHIEEAQQ